MKKYNRVYVEITNICNLNCSFCPKNKRPKQFMSLENFEHIAKQIAPLTNNICLHVMGEPLLHPQLEQIFEICKQNKLAINLTTNGTLLKQCINLLLQNPVRKISVSLHSFEANNTTQTLDEYLTPIVNCCKQITANTETYFEFRLWNNGGQNANNKLNNVIIQKLQQAFGDNQRILPDSKNYTLSNNVFWGFDNVFEWPINTTNNPPKPKKFCQALRTHFAILCDGTVVPCCLDSEGKIPLGNALQQNIFDILSSSKTQQLFNGFSNRNISEKFCQTCTFANRFDKPL